MNGFWNHRKQKRRELERRIQDAAEGGLNSSEIRNLEEELSRFPDLQQDYRKIMHMPDIASAYRQPAEHFRDELHIRRIQQLLRQEQPASESFEELALAIFKKYALAASMTILVVSGLLQWVTPSPDRTGEATVSEMFYTYEEDDGQDYLLYLDEWIQEE